MSINELAQKCHEDAKTLGWYDKGKTRSDLEALMLVVTEVSEAIEELRSCPENPAFVYYVAGKPEGYGVELADAIIRLLDLCAYRKLPIGELIEQKLKYNLTRGHRHGGKAF